MEIVKSEEEQEGVQVLQATEESAQTETFSWQLEHFTRDPALDHATYIQDSLTWDGILYNGIC